MCSEDCPCYDEGGRVDASLHEAGADFYHSDAKEEFEGTFGEFLPYYGRSRHDDDSDSELTPLVWTRDRKNSYETFIQCIDAWEAKAEKDSSIDLIAKFNFDALYVEPNESRNDPLLVKSAKIIDRNVLEFYSELESRFICSGMC